MSKDRLEAFSDGVFGFAATLLILGIALPAGHTYLTEHDLRTALIALWPNVLAYALSFTMIGIVWQNHHVLSRTIARVDRMTVLLNLILLGITAFIPFATGLLGSYSWSRSAACLYGLTLTASATIFNLLMMHLARSNAFLPGISQRAIHDTAVSYRIAWLTYAVGTAIALASPRISFAFYIGIAIFHLIPRGVDSDTIAP